MHDAGERLLLWWGSRHIGETIRRAAVLRALQPRLERRGCSVLDAGCGRGDLACTIARERPDVHVDAIDVDPSMAALVGRRVRAAALGNCTIRTADLTTFDGGHRYGTVYCVDVLEHVADPRAAIRTLSDALAPRGCLVIHVPNAEQRRWFRRFTHYHQDDHVREGFATEELRTLCTAAGLEVVEVRHTFGPPGALAWECWHFAAAVGRWCALLAWPLLRPLAWLDGRIVWRRGNGILIVAVRT